MQMRPFFCMIKVMYEFAFSVYTIETYVTELDAREHARHPLVEGKASQHVCVYVCVCVSVGASPAVGCMRCLTLGMCGSLNAAHS